MALKTHSKSAKEESKVETIPQAPFRKRHKLIREKGVLGSESPVIHISHTLTLQVQAGDNSRGSLCVTRDLVQGSLSLRTPSSQNTLTLTRECTCMKRVYIDSQV